MRTAVLLVLGLASLGRDAHAEPPAVVQRNDAEVTPAEANEPPRLLQFESSLDVDTASFDERTLSLQRGRGKLELTGTWRPAPGVYEDNDRVRAWHTGTRASYDVGWARLSAFGTYGHAENELGSGNVANLGLEISRTIQLSADVEAFVSLSLGRQRWMGRPLSGEYNDTQLRLTAGLRWR